MIGFFFLIIITIILIVIDHCKTAAKIKHHAPEAQKNIARRQAAWDELNRAIYGK